MAADLIDAHQHFWRLSRGDYAWLTPDLAPLYRNFEPADLAPLMASAGVARTVVVQAAPTVAETRHLLSLASETDWIAGVVGWVDFESPRVAETLGELARDPRLVGVRPMIQDIADPHWMLRDDLTPAYEALIALDLGFDALVRPAHLRALRQLAERHPALRIVVDHAAKPDIASSDTHAFGAWEEDLGALARAGTAACKLSGLVTEAGADWKTDDLRRTVEHLFDVFGAERLMWGSDWPVVELAGGYRVWIEATRALLAERTSSERSQVQQKTAANFYRLEPAQD